MASRLNLHNEFKTLLGNNNVYFQPPSNIQMKYPCIVYKRNRDDIKRADNKSYILTRGYQVTYITENPDDDLFDRLILHFPMIDSSAHYVVDNLHHDVAILYY